MTPVLGGMNMSFSPATAVSIAGSGLRELLRNVDNISGKKYPQHTQLLCHENVSWGIKGQNITSFTQLIKVLNNILKTVIMHNDAFLLRWTWGWLDHIFMQQMQGSNTSELLAVTTICMPAIPRTSIGSKYTKVSTWWIFGPYVCILQCRTQFGQLCSKTWTCWSDWIAGFCLHPDFLS